jgi:hypothetical protein
MAFKKCIRRLNSKIGKIKKINIKLTILKDNIMNPNTLLNQENLKKEYYKCFNKHYLESCEIAKKIAETDKHTCNDLNWDSNTRINVGSYCRNKLELQLDKLK